MSQTQSKGITMKRLTFLIACIFLLVSCAGCIPFKRVNKLKRMALSDLNVRAVIQDGYEHCTLYRAEESFGVSGYDRSLYMDKDGNFYFYYDSYCESPFRIRILTEKKKIEVKPIDYNIKAEDIRLNTEIPLTYLESPELKAFSTEPAFLLNARVINRHHQKKCDVGIGDIEFELVDAENIFYLLSILNSDDREEIFKLLPDDMLAGLIENHFDDIDAILKVAKSNDDFKNKLFQVTLYSETIKNELESMSDMKRQDFMKKIDDPAYITIISNILRGLPK